MNDMVHITNIKDDQIFQQVNGYADIPVEGTFHMTPQPNREDHHVVLMLYRELNNTMVCAPVVAELKDEKFSAVLPHIPAGGPYRLQANFVPLYNLDWGIRGEVKFNLGVGDLYVIAGQSNSAGYGKTPAYDPPCAGVHILRNNRNWRQAAHPLNECCDSERPNSEGCVTGNSPWVRFAATLHRELNYPIGLVQTSLGGSPIAKWNPKQEGVLYNNMLEAIRDAGGMVAGVLWYQGCTETSETAPAEEYLTHFTEMVEALRADLAAPTLPFFTIQLNKMIGQRDETRRNAWALVSEAQRKAAEVIPAVYVVPSYDLSLSDNIHNDSAANAILGERLAYLALEEKYHRAYFGHAPHVKKAVQLKDGRVCVTFESVYTFIETHQILPENLEFIFEDEQGACGVAAYELKENGKQFVLTPSRRLEGKTTVSFSPYNEHYAVPPIERATGLPILPFYRVAVEM